MPGIDTASLAATLQNMKTSLETLQSAAGQMSTKLDGMQNKTGNTFRCEHSGSTDDTLTTSVKSTEYWLSGDWMLQSTHLPEM